MLSRRIARPLLASWFVAEGLDAVRRPAPHADRMRETWHRVAARVDLPDPPPQATLTLAVKAHGGAMAVAALMLALGKAPRTSALALAALTVPLAVADAPTRRAPGGSRPLLRDLSLIGGALLAGLDREGSPSLTWRVQHARAERAAAHAAG
jgi:uncharacterized membrane protein YphA (DoxX/SURF4 family)